MTVGNVILEQKNKVYLLYEKKKNSVEMFPAPPQEIFSESCLLYLYTMTLSNSSVSHLVVSKSVTPWIPLPMEFFRQEYWGGLPFPTPGDVPDPGIQPRSPTLQGDSLPSEPRGKPVTFSIL